MTDNEWLDLIKTSPRKAHEALIDQYGDLVYAIVLSKLKACVTREEIQDCVSDVFVEIFRNSDRYAANGSIKSYLGTIAKRTAINAYKSIMYRNRNTGYMEDEEREIPEKQDDPSESAEKKMFRKRLWEIVRELGEPDSTIIVYQYFYDMKVKEIAQRLSMTEFAVHKRSRRAREKLRQRLESENLL